MFDKYPDVMTVQQVQEALSVGRNKVYQLVKENKIQPLRIGNVIRIPKSRLIDYILLSQYNSNVMCLQPESYGGAD